MVTITFAELKRNFAALRERALQTPVCVAEQGHESLVVITAEEFERLKALDTRKAYYVWELPDDLAAALHEAVPSPECPDL